MSLLFRAMESPKEEFYPISSGQAFGFYSCVLLFQTTASCTRLFLSNLRDCETDVDLAIAIDDGSLDSGEH